VDDGSAFTTAGGPPGPPDHRAFLRAALTTALHHHGAHFFGARLHFILGHFAVGVFIHLLETAFDLRLLWFAELREVDAAIVFLSIFANNSSG